MVGDVFFSKDPGFTAIEIPCEAEVKAKEQLDVPLPADNLDFHQLAMVASQNLPRDPTQATREKLREIVNYQPCTAVATKTGEETRGGIQAAFWTLRMSDAWTVPVTELTRGAAKSTVILIADAGRKSAANDLEGLLNQGHRVLAVDPTFYGEAGMGGRTYLHVLLVATLGQRALGIEAAQISAVSRWAAAEFKMTSEIHTIGPRSSLSALVAKAIGPKSIGVLHPTQHIDDLHGIIRNNWTVQDKPEMFCFGLLESFNVPQLKALAAEAGD